MRLVTSLVLAGVLTAFVVFASSVPQCGEWCVLAASMVGFPTLIIAAVGFSELVGIIATFFVWFFVFWLIRRSRHRHHVRDRIPHRGRRSRHRHHARDRIHRK